MDTAVCLMMPPDAWLLASVPSSRRSERQGNTRGRENGRGAQKREIESVSIILSEFPLICTPSLRRRGVCPHVSAPTNPGARVGLEEAC
jgi:hypothetical protein